MKKIKFSLVLFFLSIVIAGCSSNQNSSIEPRPENSSESELTSESDIDYPTKPIKMIVSYGAGGGTDTGARLLAPILEEKLGAPVVIENKPGAAGWIGWQELVNANPDGYTLGFINAPAIIAGYLNPSTGINEDLDSFTHIISHVNDAGVIAVRADDNRFNTIEELIEYAKENELTINANGVGTENHITILEMNEQLGTQFSTVQFTGAAESLTSVLGGHVDVLLAKVGEVNSSQEEGGLKVLATMIPSRVPQLPNVPTFQETIGSDIEFYSLRTIAGPKGLDPKIVSILQDALEEAFAEPGHIQKMAEMGLNIDGTKGEDLVEVLKNEEEKMLNVKSVLGW
ncbi:tripartite tricarboxylate transporter substrate binding protein [Halalkalibacter alkalisediminis]|uniref:Tripartite tricarboxylate transporter substrate binding protein n=1 Tax=Halalkalibacter alkalisediminis TaxID=935616 RepID=A0ABV6NNX7_9BACI|nr:tripartite tricarboxylate transporter substrate binding protein [Halalkalibacter alkalisediminis]